MSSSLLAVVVDCRDPRAQAHFWSRAMSCGVVERNTDEYLVGDPSGPVTPLYFMKVPEPKKGKNRLHLITEGPLGDEIRRLTDLGSTPRRGAAGSRLAGESRHLGGMRIPRATSSA